MDARHARGGPDDRRRAWRWLLGLLAAVAAVGVPISVLEGNGRTVGLVGDSLTAESVPAITAYLAAGGDKVDPMALAGSGLLDTDVDWLAHAHQLVSQDDPSAVVVEFIGDYGFGGERPGIAPYSPAFYRAWALVSQQMENVLTSRGAKVYWVIGPPVANPMLEGIIATLDHIYEHLHAPNTSSGRPPLIDVTPAMTGGTGVFREDLPGPGGLPIEVRTPDGTHFTLYGTTLYGRAIAAAVL